MLRRLLNLIHAQQPIGRRGETIAARWLRKRGYRILQRNLPLMDDEADLVALDPDGRTIVIVEVKTSAGAADCFPEERITRRKQRHVARLAARLSRTKPYANRPMRFDAVGVAIPPTGKPIVRHHPGAFESPW